MKRTNKSIVVLLTIAMLLVGLHILPNEAQATTSIENPDMLNVKWQMTSTPLAEGDEEISKYNANAGDYLVRLVSSVDSLKYSKVGFILTNLDTGVPKDSGKIFADRGEEELNKTVYKRINAPIDEGSDYTFGPKVVDTSSEYFITAKTYINPNTEYQVQAYVIPKGSDEKVLGPSRYIKLADHIEKDDGSAKENTVISFEATDATKYTVNDTVGVNDEDYSATVLYKNGSTVKVSIPIKYSSLPSAKKFTFATGDNVIYRNLYSANSTADASWYTVYNADGETEFVIATEAELLALDTVVDIEGIDKDDKFYLAADMTFDDESTWTPAGQTNAFTATFDGNDHKISGLNIVAGDNSGFFGITSGSTIKDLEIVDADYNATKGTNIGIIAGKGYGTFENITIDNTSSVTMNTTNKNVGGIIGQVVSNETASFVNCTVNANVTSKGQIVGGFIGLAHTGATVHITGCIFDAEVQSSEIIVGGLIGQVSSESTVQIGQTAVAGNVKTSGAKAQVGGMIGYLYQSTATIEECLVSATINGLQHVGGLVGYACTDKVDKDCTITVTDCHISGEIIARAAGTTESIGTASTGALIGWARDNNTSTDTNEININVTRCLMSGKISMPNEISLQYKSVYVGKMDKEVNLTFNQGVCYVKDNLNVNVNDGEYQLYQGTITGTITGDSGVTAYTEAELKEQNPFENNSKWTTQPDNVPTLSIFATSN